MRAVSKGILNFIELFIYLGQGRRKEQKISIALYFLREQLVIQGTVESQAPDHCQAMIIVMLSNLICYFSNLIKNTIFEQLKI